MDIILTSRTLAIQKSPFDSADGRRNFEIRLRSKGPPHPSMRRHITRASCSSPRFLAQTVMAEEVSPPSKKKATASSS